MIHERRKKILEILNNGNASIGIEELSQALEVSLPTVRRDLVELENQGLIIRQRGGVSLPGLGIEPKFLQREKENRDLKKSIVEYAAEQIMEGEVIAIDVGTTNAELAKRLISKKNITVFTASFQVASILSRSQIQVYLIGGFLRKMEMSLVGTIATDTIMNFTFDRFYLGLSGISNEEGATDYSIDDAAIKRAFIKRSKSVTALVDKTKFGNASLIKVCDLNDIDEIVTNKEGNEIALQLDYSGNLVLI